MAFGTEKTRMAGYPTVKKIENIVVRFDTIHERDGQKDRHTDTA